MKTKSFIPALALGLAATPFACHDNAVVAPDEGVVNADNLVVTAKKPTNPGGGDDFVWTDLRGGYATVPDDPQKTSLSESPKKVAFIAKGGKEIDYSLDPEALGFEEHYEVGDCRAGGAFRDVISSEQGMQDFWNGFLAAQVDHPHRLLTSVVLPRESGLPNEGHRSEGYWFTEDINASLLPFPASEIDDDSGELNKLMWLYKIGTNSSLFDPDTGPRAVATWDDQNKVAVFTGGVVWLKIINCGRPGSKTCKLGGMSVGCDNTDTDVWFETAVNHTGPPPS